MYYYQKINRTICFFEKNTNLLDNKFYLKNINQFFLSLKLILNKLNIYVSNDLIFYIYETIFNQFIYKDFYFTNNDNSLNNDKLLYNYFNKINIELILLYNIKKYTFFDTFSFYKYSTIKKNYNLFDNFIDIGYIYIGLGNLITFSKFKNSNLFFFRNDGGSNGFQVLYNDNYIKNVNFSKVKKYKLLNCKNLIKILCNYEIINNLNYYLI